jgi:hypothetical protein
MLNSSTATLPSRESKRKQITHECCQPQISCPHSPFSRKISLEQIERGKVSATGAGLALDHKQLDSIQDALSKASGAESRCKSGNQEIVQKIKGSLFYGIAEGHATTLQASGKAAV